MRRLALTGFLLLGSVFTPLAANAQDCEIDLTDAIIALTQAQADATRGDTASALGAITDVQVALDSIRGNCPRTAETTYDLSETFTAPDDLFSFNYPAGWFEAEYDEGRDWEARLAGSNPLDLPIPPGGITTVTSQEVALSYGPLTFVEGAETVSIYTGSPLHLFAELGLYSEEFGTAFLEGTLDFETLLDEFETAVRQSPESPEVNVERADAERPIAGVEAQTSSFKLTMVLVALDEAENYYALLISPSPTEGGADMLPLLLAMAETVE